ncbi:MAG TPA: tetratricopeptide repeat protein [Stellaceae bacterium]|nr:tetratricopeptide repeat protein [Stellaceae bacterium]
MQGKLFSVVLSFGLVLAASALAQSRDANWQQCAHGSPDLVIGACTAIIQSGGETDQNLARVFTNRATGYNRTGQVDLAIGDLSQAIRLDPTYAIAIKLRGDLYGGKRRYDLSEADYNRAIQLNPNDGGAWGGRALAYFSEDRFDLAIQDCNRAILLNPNDALSYDIRGISKQQTGDAAGGAADIARARQLDPNLPQ